MNELDNSNLLMWKEISGRYRFQTTDSKIARRMKNRKRFYLTANGAYEKFWIFYCDLPDICAAKKRFKGLSGRIPKYDISAEIYY